MKFRSLKIETSHNYQTHKDELIGQIGLTSDNNKARIYLKMTHNELIEMLKIVTPIFERSTNEKIKILKEEWLKECKE